MVEISDRLRCLFSATLERRGDSYLLEVPHEELDEGEVMNGETYRIAILPHVSSQPGTGAGDRRQQRPTFAENGERTPPVEAGDVREMTIETIGDQGDGIAKVERGYVVIVPGTDAGDEVSVEITNTRENVAFARVRDDENEPAEPGDFGDRFANETLGEDE